MYSLAGVDLGAFLAEAALVAFGLASSSNSESSSLATGESSKSEESDMVTAVIATEVRFKFTARALVAACEPAAAVASARCFATSALGERATSCWTTN